MNIILIRHGETMANKQNIIQGHTDTALSDFGRLQAFFTSKRLAKVSIAAIYASDLKRAYETAEIIAIPHNIPVKADDRIRECSFGVWEGLSIDDVKERYEEQYEAYRLDSIKNRAPGGERLEQLQARVIEAVKEIASRHPDETVAIVTHGGPIKALFCYVLDVELQVFRRIGVSNCSLSTIRFEPSDGWYLGYFNDRCHLDGIKESDAAASIYKLEYLT